MKRELDAQLYFPFHPHLSCLCDLFSFPVARVDFATVKLIPSFFVAPGHKAFLCPAFLWLQETAFIYRPSPSPGSNLQIQAVVN